MFLLSCKPPGRSIGLGIAFSALPAAAFAHPGHGVEGFADGFVHPLQGLDHLIAMVAVGLIAAKIGGRALWEVPVAFLSMMTLGGCLGMQGAVLPFAETGILFSVAVFGLALLFDWKVSAVAAVAISGLFAVFHGYLHGIEMVAGTRWAAYASGFILSTALLIFAGIGLGIGIGRISAVREAVQMNCPSGQ